MARNAVLRRFRPLDAVIIAACFIGFIVSVRALPVFSGRDVTMYRDGRLAARFPLAHDRDATIPGAMGNVTIRINRNSVRVISADCPEKICIMTGSIRLPAQQIICAPNHILITIGAQEGSCDAVTR